MFFPAFYGSFRQAQPQVRAPASVGGWIGFISSLSRHPPSLPQPDDSNLAPIEQYQQSKIFLSLSIGPNKTA